jgi:hypothetical protein
LEARTLLSNAQPFHVLLAPGGEPGPLGTAGPTGYTPAQIRHAYGFDQIAFPSGVAADGSGTTIAIVDAYDDPTIAADLAHFDAQFGLPNPVFVKVNQSGGVSYPPPDAGWAGEIALDVEWAHAIAPGAKILLVEAQDNSFINLFAAIRFAAAQPGVDAVSMSWGSQEFPGESSWDKAFTTPSGHTGVTFLASSGDAGAPADYPAVSPNVVAVGGTTLHLGAGGAYLGESGWSGSGGGVSAQELQPPYQKGVVTQSGVYRTTPDVAFDADPNTGFSVYDTFNNSASCPWEQFGGTSDAAPQWAGLIAIADQGRILAGESPLDGPTQTLPMLYALPAGDFHDITSGVSAGSPAEAAGPGYDLVTGRGSPVANRVIGDLVGPAGIAPAATHFGISAPAGTTAGATFSVTVTVLDGSNSLVAGYRGTVQFTSSDRAALLPGSYTFTAADNGIHTFAGVTLNTAGSQTVAAADTGNGALTCSAWVTVNTGTAKSPGSGSGTPVNPTNPNQRFVAAAYQDILGRTVDAAGLAAWSALLDQGMAPAQVAAALAHSAEHYANLVTVAFQRYLGRTPAGTERNAWVGLMQGGLTDEWLEATLVGSPEYTQNHGGAGAGWITGLYQDLLGRPPALAELIAWAQALAAGMSEAQIAHGFAASAEREGQRIGADYQQYLGRTPASAEQAGWVNVLLQGLTDEAVIAALVGSAEYYGRNAAG